MLQPDRAQIETFVEVLFKHAGRTGFVSMRSFYEDESRPYRALAAGLSGGLAYIVEAAVGGAVSAANAHRPVVFCPPIAIFSTRKTAKEKDIAKGLALSVDCDRRPDGARATLERLLGPATIVVRSGGEWVDPETGELQNKLHLHWRLKVPASSKEALNALKRARGLAIRIVGGDPTNISPCHPMRWAGSLHRKATPLLCRIEAANPDREISLADALAALEGACPGDATRPNGERYSESETNWTTPVQQIVSAEHYHEPIRSLAAKLLHAGMIDEAAGNLLRALMDASQGPRDNRWQMRYDDIDRAVSTARAKFNPVPGLTVDVNTLVNLPALLTPEQGREPQGSTSEPNKDPFEPYTHVPGIVGRIVDWITATARRPNRVLALGAAITVVGTLIGRRAASPTRSATHLYVVPIARTGAGKQHIIDSAERLMRAAKADAHLGPSKFHSGSAVLLTLQAMPLMLCLQDEIGAVIYAVTNRKAQSHERAVSEALRGLWNVSFAKLRTPSWATREDIKPICCPAMSILGFSTPDEFHASLQGESIENGLLNRFLTLMTGYRSGDTDPALDPYTVPPSLSDDLHRLYLWSGPESLLSICDPTIMLKPHILPWASCNARVCFADFQKAIDQKADMPEVGVYYARCAEMAIRLATIRAAGRQGCGARVDFDDMRWGISVAETACQAMQEASQNFMRQTERGDLAAKLAMLVRRRTHMTVRQIQQHVRSRYSSVEIRRVMSELVETGEFELDGRSYRAKA
jgi:hypothetical protein